MCLPENLKLCMWLPSEAPIIFLLDSTAPEDLWEAPMRQQPCRVEAAKRSGGGQRRGCWWENSPGRGMGAGRVSTKARGRVFQHARTLMGSCGMSGHVQKSQK